MNDKMASELLNSLCNACRTHGHIIYNQSLNDGHGGFERAGGDFRECIPAAWNPDRQGRVEDGTGSKA